MPSFLAAVAGVVLRGFFALVTLVRRPRPIHARGVLLHGEVRWRPAAVDAGIAWIDEPSTPVSVRARLSRSVGLPSPLPDVIGLALRIDTSAGPADLELASTGTRVLGRFALVPRRRPSSARLGALLPYRGTRGAVLISASTHSPERLPADLSRLGRTLGETPWHLTLSFATPTGPWRRFAELTLRVDPDQDDTELRFDAVRRPLPGAGAYRWVRVLREPSYLFVQGR